MRELHVVALSEDGRHVVLATRAGAPSGEFRVALDERLTAAVRGELPAPGRDAPPSISPRDIQARLRDGESPEDIAASAGVPLSRVERYAGPVLAELERMITGARGAVVTRPRLGPSSRPLGEAVEAHLAEVAHLAEGSVRWSARRGDLGRWVVSVSWTARGRRRTAGWHYDPASREVTAVDGPSAVLGHVEAEAAAAPAAARAPRPAAATSTPRTTGAGAPAASRPARTPAPSPSRTTPAATGSAARPAALPGRPASASAPVAPAARSTTSRSATARPAAPAASPSRAAAGAAAAAGSPARPTRPSRTTAAASTRSAAANARDTAGTAAPAPTSTPRRRTPSAEERAAPRTAAQRRRPAARRSAVPSLDELAGAAADAPAAPAARAPRPAPPGPPVLRVVPPAAPEPEQPEPAEDAAPPEARPARRAAGQRSGGRDWADVLMGGAPAPPAAEPRQD